MRMNRLYVRAYGRMVSVLPKRRISGFWNKSPNRRMSAPAIREQVKLVDAVMDAWAKGLNDRHQAENDADRTACARIDLSDKVGVCHVIKAGYEHTDRSWDT